MTALALTAGLAAEMTGGHLVAGSPDRLLASVSIDTRTMPAGALFVAIRGERFDGHAFVGEALVRGAAGLLVSTMPAEVDVARAAVIAVPDTTAALQRLGQSIRERSRARVVAVTGSAGKTTTKEVTADLLAARYRVFRNAGNLNNHLGLPLSLTALASGYDAGVFELGMNHAGEIRLLVGLARPDVRVWTNVGDAHIGHFESREAIARAKAEILESPGADDLLIVNADDPLVMAHASGWSGRRIGVGEAPDAGVRLVRAVDRGFDGTESEVSTLAGPLALRLALAGRAQLANVLLAVAVAVDFGVPAAEIEARVAALHPIAHRGTSLRLANGVRVIDDAYNASPAAVKAMIAALAATPGVGRRVAVLGEMLELGDLSRALHESCGAAAAAAGLDALVVVGGSAADGVVDGARRGGLDVTRISRFADSRVAADVVPGLVRAGDLVLVKGSHGTRMDLVVDALRGSEAA